MKSKSNDLYIKLKQGPAVLLLGQHYLKLESGTDPFLAQVLRKYGPEDATPNDYTQIHQGNAQNSGESALAWMQQLCDRLSIPGWLKIVTDFAWSHIYTSAIDTIWWKAFRNEWRGLYPIFQEKQKPIDLRSRSNLHCTFLFGCVNRVEEMEYPPFTRHEFLKRKQMAVLLTHRLPEIITPFGTLIIEGYAGDIDWLSPDNLLPVLFELNPGQTHIFSATEQIERHPDFSVLVNEGKLTLHREGLATYLLKGQELGLIQLGLSIQEKEHGRLIQIGENIHKVPNDLWNRVSKSATILDESILVPLPTISEDKKYQEFRTFLVESGIKPLWYGYQRGYAFQRKFEKQLWETVEKKLKSKKLQDEPIILHGQSGTGKTVALGALAYEIKKRREFPVLFIERKSHMPLNSDIDAFCKWSEDSGAGATLVIWDGMLEVAQYHELLRYLGSRGRKVVLVGSCYHLDEAKTPLRKSTFIPAPPELTEKEISEFAQFLSKFNSSFSLLLDDKFVDETFLVALYRLLPSTRSSIRSGLVKEVGFAEQKIMKASKEQEFTPTNALGYALWEAGLVDVKQMLLSQTKEIAGEEFTIPQEIIGLIMVPGRFGLQVPLELLLRALKKEWVQNMEKIFDVDIFEWYESKDGSIMIAPRHPLEARLITQARFGIATQEVEFAKKLIAEIRNDELTDNLEVEFAVDLVRSMGPNSLNYPYFAPCFLELARALEKLRTERSLQHPRLMLQEATLIRETVSQKNRINEPVLEAEELLDKAESILRQALELLQDNNKNARLRSFILVELGSMLGTKIHQYLAQSIQYNAFQTFQEARRYLFKARMLNPDDYHSTDVLGWMTEDLLKSKVLDQPSEIEVKADILHLFSLINPEDFDIEQRERYYQRRMKVGDLLGDEDLSEEAFQALAKHGSGAGYFLRASRIVRDIPANIELNTSQRALYQKAFNYLEENRKVIENDSRCLRLLLKLWWTMHAGKPLFFGERQTIPFDQEDWGYLLQLVNKLMSTEEGFEDPSLKYLKGVATFHLGSIEGARDIFRELERAENVGGRRRIIRSYLASTEDGHPRMFHGTVAWINNTGTRGEVFVEELRYRIAFIPYDFRPEIRQHDPLSEGEGFHIAFNFIGPIADPQMRYKSPKE